MADESQVSGACSSVTQEIGRHLGEFGATRDGRRLIAALCSLASASSLDERIDGLHEVIGWTRRRARVPPSTTLRDVSPGFRRFVLLLEVLEQAPSARQVVADAATEILGDTDGTNLIGSAGLPSGQSFLAEATDRLIARFLPMPRDDHDLGRACLRLFRSRADVEGVARMPPELFARLVGVLEPRARPDLQRSMRNDFADGFRLLATRVRAHGLNEKIRERSAASRVSASAFFRLCERADALAEAWGEARPAPEVVEECRALIPQCRAAVEEVSRRIETSGVSVDIVYRLEIIERCLGRMSRMLDIIEARDAATRARRLHDFFALLVTRAHEDRSLRLLVRNGMALLGRKIIERTGQSGEHYVAQTKGDYRHIWAAAAGGGIVAALIGAAKFPIMARAFAPFLEGLALSGVYIGGFLLMQVLGLILATKQPAMFGATLASIFRQHDARTQVDEAADLAVRIWWSQLAATASNLLMVGLTAYAVQGVWWMAFGVRYLNDAEAFHVLESLSPLDSGTVAYAALTGVLLWWASLAGGWLDNWSVYHRIPQGIADHPIGHYIGWRRTARLAGLWSRGAAGIGANVMLGLMLGMTPILGAFLGLPLDVRHVTLSAGKLGLACASLENCLQQPLFLRSLAGIGVMFVLNLGVSFLLAMYAALRAYGLPSRMLWEVLLRFVRRVREQPLRSPEKPNTSV